MSRAIGQRHSWDLVLLWLWRRPAAVAPILPLAWELPYAAGAALKSKTPPPKITIGTTPPPGSIREKEPMSQPEEGSIWGHFYMK